MLSSGDIGIDIKFTMDDGDTRDNDEGDNDDDIRIIDYHPISNNLRTVESLIRHRFPINGSLL